MEQNRFPLKIGQRSYFYLLQLLKFSVSVLVEAEISVLVLVLA
jgi:hypothetical protein